MKERLKKIRSTLGYSQQEMADKLNIPVRAYRTYEYVSKGYPVEFIQNLIENFNVNANYLFTGEGNMFLTSNIYKPLNANISIKESIKKFGSRLSDLQNKINITDKIFAKTIGLYEDEYLELKSGEREPNLKILVALKQNFNFSLDFLLFGQI